MKVRHSWLGLAVVAAFLAMTGTSNAACGGTQTSRAAHHPAGQTPPLAIGDSTMLLSLPGLAAEGYDGNAHGCRQFFQALDMLRQLRAQDALPHMVAIALGANGSVTAADIDQALSIMCCNRLLVLVTPRELGGGSGSDAATERAAARAHPGRILLLDWVRYSAGHGNWFAPDGLHLNPPGVQALTRLLAGALPYAYVPCPAGSRSHARRALRHRSAARASASGTLSLTTTLRHLGWVGVKITGTPGTAVALGEREETGPGRYITTVQIPSSGTVTIPHAVTWLCKPRTRSLLAAVQPPAAPASVTATVTTPSCRRRLRVVLTRRARVGTKVRLRIVDRWGTGDLRLKSCLAPPGAREFCARESIATGRTSISRRFAVPRVGGWQVTVSTAFGQRIVTDVWARHRGQIRMLAAGDSEMQILDTFLGQDLGPSGVGVSSDARISTGLTNSFFFDWQTEARRRAAAYHPDLTVVFMGANDGFSTPGPHGPVGCCGRDWSEGYAKLVAEMMGTLLQGQSGRVYWFLLPAPRPPKFQSLFNAVNLGIRLAAKRFPGRVGLIDANAFFTPGNRYRDFMTVGGHGFTIHESDGIHLSTASDRIAAILVKRALVRDRVIR